MRNTIFTLIFVISIFSFLSSPMAAEIKGKTPTMAGKPAVTGTPAKVYGVKKPGVPAKLPVIKMPVKELKITLIQKRSRLLLEVDRYVRKVEVYTGKKKLGELKAGKCFDITKYLSKSEKGRLLFICYDGEDNKYSEEFHISKYAYLMHKKKPTKGKEVKKGIVKKTVKTVKPPKPPIFTKAEPLLSIERIYQKGGKIHVVLKNKDRGRLSATDYRNGKLVFSYGGKKKSWRLNKIDPKGRLNTLKKELDFDTGLVLEKGEWIKVELENVKAEKFKQVRLTPTSKMAQRIAQKKKLKTHKGEGRGGGGDDDLIEPPCPYDLEIQWLYITTPGPGERRRVMEASYEYGAEQDVIFVAAIRNNGPCDFSGRIYVDVFCESLRVTGNSSFMTITIKPDDPLPEYIPIYLDQATIVESSLAPGRTYTFRAEISDSMPPDPHPENDRSRFSVALHLLRPHPVGQAIPKQTITLTSQDHLTGSVSNEGDTQRSLQVGNCGMTLTARGFISFNIAETQIVAEFLRRGHRCTGFELRSATLEIEEYQFLSFVPGEWDPWYKKVYDFFFGGIDTEGRLQTPRSCSGGDLSSISICLDYLVGYGTFSPSIYNAPMVTNLLTFQSTCGVHSFANLEAYVRYQLERGEGKIQFRLRFADEDVEGDPAWTYVYSVFFRNPQLTITVVPKE